MSRKFFNDTLALSFFIEPWYAKFSNMSVRSELMFCIIKFEFFDRIITLSIMLK